VIKYQHNRRGTPPLKFIINYKIKFDNTATQRIIMASYIKLNSYILIIKANEMHYFSNLFW